MIRTVQSMVDEALALITTHQVDEARALHGRDDVVFVCLLYTSPSPRD